MVYNIVDLIEPFPASHNFIRNTWKQHST